MAYCKNCGSQINDFAANCPECGASQQQANSGRQTTNYAANDTGGFGWGLLGFCVPLAGLILYLVWMNERPRTAKAAGMGALISVIFSVLYYIVVVIIAAGSAAAGY